jgi:hypothetical protein
VCNGLNCLRVRSFIGVTECSNEHLGPIKLENLLTTCVTMNLKKECSV